MYIICTFYICQLSQYYLIFSVKSLFFCADVLCAAKYIVDYTRNQNT